MMWDDVLKPMLGTPYVLNGRSRDGVDCLGLIVYAYQAMGFDVSAIDKHYPQNVAFRQFLSDFRAATEPGSCTPGAIVLLRDVNRTPVHLGIQGEEFAYHSVRGSCVQVLDTVENRRWYRLRCLS